MPLTRTPAEPHTYVLYLTGIWYAVSITPTSMGSALTLNSASYDPIDQANTLFFHPAALPSVSATSDALCSHQHDLDEDIAGVVTLQSTADADSVQRI